jgi:hypothetical protein
VQQRIQGVSEHAAISLCRVGVDILVGFGDAVLVIDPKRAAMHPRRNDVVRR